MKLEELRRGKAPVIPINRLSNHKMGRDFQAVKPQIESYLAIQNGELGRSLNDIAGDFNILPNSFVRSIRKLGIRTKPHKFNGNKRESKLLELTNGSYF